MGIHRTEIAERRHGTFGREGRGFHSIKPFDTSCSFQQRLHFLATENERKPPLVSWERDALDLDLTLECVRVEQAQCADQLNAGGRTGLFFLDQK